MQPGRFTVRSFNPLMPMLDVSGSVPGEGVGNGGLEYYDAPGGGPTSPQEATRQAQLGSQASAASHAGVFGKASSGRIEPARTLRVAGHPVTRFDRGFFVTRVRTRIVQRRRDQATSDERPFTCWFDAIVDDMPFRPPRITPPAQQAGLQSGMVVGPPGQEIHTDEQGSVRVRLHWDRQGTDGWWMRVAQRGAADSLQLPRIGWNVLTFNDEGAADAPSVLARILDAEHPPPYALPENKTRVVFKTATSPGGGSFNEIYFEDTKGAEQMFINASKDMKVLAQQAKIEGVNNDSTHTIGNNHSLTIKRTRRESVLRDQSVTIGGNETLEAAQSFSHSVGADAVTNIAGSRKIEVGGSHTTTVEQGRSLSVGAALIDISLGDITAQAETINLLVGGAQLKVAAQGIRHETGGVGVFTVGAAKLQFIAKERALDVSKQYIESIGGLLMCKSAGKYTDNASVSQTWNVGGAIQASAPEVKIEATEKVEIVCGASSITLYPDSVELRSTNLDLGEASDIEVKTAIIKHN
jgi:type VI secretion system secreted protein VgrG